MLGTSLVGQWWRFCLSVQGVWVEFLVRELRSHEAKNLKHKKQKQSCNRFNQDFKKVHAYKERPPSSSQGWMRCPSRVFP